MDYAAIMNSCDEKADRLGLAALTDIERVVSLVSRANFEIELGGLSGFFYNSSGDDAAEAAAALEAVGAMRAATAVRSAMARLPDGDRSRQQVLDSFQSLDSEYYNERPDVFSRLCSYIEFHKAELRGHIRKGAR